jgi:hypothetical protein
MVSTSTRRFPSTPIVSTVWATAGATTNAAAKVAATGTPNMIRAANKPPLTRIPKIMRNAALILPMPVHAPTDQQIPTLAA